MAARNNILFVASTGSSFYQHALRMDVCDSDSHNPKTTVCFGKPMYDALIQEFSSEHAIWRQLELLSKGGIYRCDSMTSIDLDATAAQVLNFFCDPTLHRLFKGTYQLVSTNEVEMMSKKKLLTWTLKKQEAQNED